MSRDEAHRKPAVRRVDTVVGPPAAGPATTGAAPPRSPLFTARTDQRSGVIHARGHLDQVGIEALTRIVSALRQLGHRQVVVQLGSATIADDALASLADLGRQVGVGVRLELPATAGPGGFPGGSRA